MSALDLTAITLTRSPNPSRSNRVCLPEAVAWFADEEHSTQPGCVSTVLLRTGSALCARLPHDKRQGLKRFVPGLVDTAGDGCDEDRSRLAMDWLVRVYLPTWLGPVPGLDLAAASLTEHAPVLSVADAAEAMSGPRAAVRRSLHGLYNSERWRHHRAYRTDLTLELSRRLSANAGDAAVVGTMAIAREFLPECGKLRLTVEQALLLAVCGHTTGDPVVRTAGDPVDRVLSDIAAGIEDAVVDLFARMIDVRPPGDGGWLAADPVEEARRVREC
ncbi:hypothetical protein [Saccharomonospora halophila]|uniref:hypothetical protein n=1 Tax=Saccharomonospora halophila TaxID=129922 RepID=UPI00037485B2|nr:hypothetical protein [Saccharomonospora halophila]